MIGEVAIRFLLQAEALIHQSLETRFVQNVVGEFFVRKHRECGTLGTSHQLGGFFNGEVWILANHRHHHADHDLQAPDISRFLLSFASICRLSTAFQTHQAPDITVSAIRCFPALGRCARPLSSLSRQGERSAMA